MTGPTCGNPYLTRTPSPSITTPQQPTKYSILIIYSKNFNLDYNLRRNYAMENNLPSTDDSFRPYELPSPRTSEPGINSPNPTDGRVIRYQILSQKLLKNLLLKSVFLFNGMQKIQEELFFSKSILNMFMIFTYINANP